MDQELYEKILRSSELLNDIVENQFKTLISSKEVSDLFSFFKDKDESVLKFLEDSYKNICEQKNSRRQLTYAIVAYIRLVIFKKKWG